MTLVDQLTSISGASTISTWIEPASGRELPLVTPEHEQSCADLIQMAASDGLAMIPIGHGSQASRMLAASVVDFALSTRGLSGIEAYEPGDGTVTVRAGTSIHELREAVRVGGHRLTPDIPGPTGSTIGGVLAGGRSGFDRLRFGPSRNHVLGMRVMLGDGTQAKTGGRLVKNVTGYDLHRLYTGSHGSLCLILEASLRLFPLPEAEVLFRGQTGSLQVALESIAAARDLPLIWDTLSIHGRNDKFTAIAALSGRSPLLSAHAPTIEDRLAKLDSLETLWGSDSVEARETERDNEISSGWPLLRLRCQPSSLEQATTSLFNALGDLGEQTSRLVIHPGLATLDLWVTQSSTDHRDELVHELYEVAARNQLQLDWFGRGPVDGERSASGSGADAALSMMRKLQSTLDPNGVFARGRFYRGL